jgi:hypothetical protein
LDHEYLPAVWGCAVSGQHGAIVECEYDAKKIVGWGVELGEEDDLSWWFERDLGEMEGIESFEEDLCVYWDWDVCSGMFIPH